MPRLPVDQIISELAAPRLAIVHARDLRDAGVSTASIRVRVANGSIAPVVRKSFAVGPQCHAPTFEMRCMAGQLAASPDALLDGVTAAKILDLWNRTCDEVHVSSTTNMRAPGTEGFRFSRRRRLWLPDDRIEVGPLAVAGPCQMAAVFAGGHTALQLAFVLGRAIYLELVTIDELDSFATDRRQAPWNAVLRSAIELVRNRSAGTRGVTEDVSLGDLLRAGAAMPIVNTRGAMGLSRDEPDFVWECDRLNIEIDGGHHDQPGQMEDDLRRDEDAAAEGWGILRVRARDFWRRRPWVVAQMLRFLDRRPVPRLPGTRILDIRSL